MNPPKERSNTITGYSLTEKQYVGKVKEKLEYYDLMNAIMVCLGEDDEEEVEHMCNLSDGVEQKGIQKGIEIGIEQGIEQANRLLIINMLKENEPIEKICRYAQCDDDIVLQIKKELF